MGSFDPTLEKIEAEIVPVMDGLGFELVALQVARAGRRRIIRILADRPHGGITLDDCTQISRAVGAAVEYSAILDSPYTLEVSSPGLDHHLTSMRDFARYVGQAVTLHMDDGSQKAGVLTKVEEDTLSLEENGEAIPFAQVKYGTRNY
jgi:ribosome maturation factor RimP